MKNKITMVAMSAILFLSSCDVKNADGTNQQLNVGSVLAILVVAILVLIGITQLKTGFLNVKKKPSVQNFAGITKEDVMDTGSKVLIVVVLLIVITLVSIFANHLINAAN